MAVRVLEIVDMTTGNVRLELGKVDVTDGAVVVDVGPLAVVVPVT